MNGRDVAKTARDLLGVPWKHQGRNPEFGLDCVGLLIEVAKRLDLSYIDINNYTLRPSPEELIGSLASCCDRTSEIEEGDILVFFFVGESWPQHVGIKTRHGMIHTARSGAGMVVEDVYDETWQKHFHSAWRYRWQH